MSCLWGSSKLHLYPRVRRVDSAGALWPGSNCRQWKPDCPLRRGFNGAGPRSGGSPHPHLVTSRSAGETAGVPGGSLWILQIPPQPLNAGYDGKSPTGSGGF